MSASARKEWREAALTAAVVGTRSEARLAKHLLACMDELEVADRDVEHLNRRLLVRYSELDKAHARIADLGARLADASARNQWLGDAS